MRVKAIRAFLRDGKRSQRGSVLSAVLIMTAFVAILSGALMTAVSTNFLLSLALVNRVAGEATVNSALEQAVSQMSSSPVYGGCPTPLAPVTLNGITAAASYAGCAATATRSPWQSNSSGVINTSGTIATVQSPGGSEYLVGDSHGSFYRFAVGASSPSWTASFGGSAAVTAPPQAMPDGTTVLVPVSDPTAPGTPGCGSSDSCVGVLAYSSSSPRCYLAANGTVVAKPAAGANFSTVAFFGDRTGTVFAYDTWGSNCVSSASGTVAPAGPVVAGPVVFKGSSNSSDEVYFLISNGSGTSLVHFSYQVSKKGVVSFAEVGALSLPANAVGMALDQGQLPARLAIAFAGGAVDVVTIAADTSMASTAGTTLPSPLSYAPAWCCGTTPTQIAVGRSHTLYLFDAVLTQLGSYSIGNANVTSSPVADGGGDWFVGAGDGNLYELSAIQSTPTVLALGQSEFGNVQSVQIGQCGSGWICAYLASSTQSASFGVQLDARTASLSACISTAPPACSGRNPRLWATVEVGGSSPSTNQTVHTQTWAYYSP